MNILHISEDVLKSGVRRPSAYARVPSEDAGAMIAGMASFTRSASVLSSIVKEEAWYLASDAGG